MERSYIDPMCRRVFSKSPMTVILVMGLSLVVLFASGTALGFRTAHALTSHAAQGAAAKQTIVNVTMGKPSELRFTLSKFSNLPAGTITFKVKDSGLAFHDFRICTSSTPNTVSLSSTTSLKNSCTGKVTPLLKPGQTAVLTVKIAKDGIYEFLCSVPGHAAAGMKGLLGVGVKVTAPATTTTTTTSSSTKPAAAPPPTTTSATTTAAGGRPPAAPADCPAGQTIVGNAQTIGGDVDEDDNGGPTDGDGCV